MAKCKSCIEGPGDIEGHADMFVTTLSGGPMQFRCRACGTLWMRSGTKDPQWTEALGNEAGAMLPQAARNS